MTTPRPALAALACLAALAGCEATRELPWGGSITLSASTPVRTPIDASNGQACIGTDERGRPALLARPRCAGDADGVIRAR